MSTTEDHGGAGRMAARPEQGRADGQRTTAAFLADSGYHMLNPVGAGGGR